MAKRSTSKLLRMKAQRMESAGAKRRRDLTQRYLDVPVQAWANMGDGFLSGTGARALREWLSTLDQLAHGPTL